MILKYFNNGCWNFVDGLHNVSKDYMGKEYAIQEYEKACGAIADIPEVPEHSKALSYAQDYIQKENNGYSCEIINLLHGNDFPGRKAGQVFMIVADNRRPCDSDKTVLITDQEVYLLSDEGKTIERLV